MRCRLGCRKSERCRKKGKHHERERDTLCCCWWSLKVLFLVIQDVIVDSRPLSFQCPRPSEHAEPVLSHSYCCNAAKHRPAGRARASDGYGAEFNISCCSVAVTAQSHYAKQNRTEGPVAPDCCGRTQLWRIMIDLSISSRCRGALLEHVGSSNLAPSCPRMQSGSFGKS